MTYGFNIIWLKYIFTPKRKVLMNHICFEKFEFDFFFFSFLLELQFENMSIGKEYQVYQKVTATNGTPTRLWQILVRYKTFDGKFDKLQLCLKKQKGYSCNLKLSVLLLEADEDGPLKLSIRKCWKLHEMVKCNRYL